MSIKPYSDTDLRVRLKGVQAKLVEVRLDGCVPISSDTLRALEQPLLLAPRTQNMERLEKLLDSSPAFLDIPHPFSAEDLNSLRRRFPNTQFILSHHDNSATPPLEPLLEEMRKSGADYYKIATTAKSGLDALRVMLFQRTAPANVIALAMGSDGEASRIAAPVLGAPWTYAALEEGAETAPGQLSVSQMREVYHYDSLSVSTSLCGVFGDPVSLSPGHLAHNAVYRQSGIDALYLRFRIPDSQLEDALLLAQKLNFRGLSITMPHKQTITKLLTRCDATASSIGAVNTVTFEGEEILGSNSDATAALDAIGDVQGVRIAILGAGGAARAIGYEATQRGASVAYYSRNPRDLQARPFDELSTGSYEVLVNATPVEMPIQAEQITPGTRIMETKTSPHETALLQEAQKKGCHIIHGWEMYTRQAAGQIEQWFAAATSPAPKSAQPF